MNGDMLVFGFVIAAFLYMSGYHSIGVLLGVGIALLFILSQFGPKEIKVPKPSNMLEPIVMESTRGPAYKIPETINLWVKPNSYPEQWWKKGMRRGAPGFIAKATVWKLYDMLHGKPGGD